jgi:hypothetical protein
LILLVETREAMLVGRNLAFIGMRLRQASAPKFFVQIKFVIKTKLLCNFEADVHP